jgi:hypothetical protein
MALAQPATRTDRALAHYLGLEDLAVLEDLLIACGATLDAGVVPFLTARLAEEEAAAGRLATHGYTRMAEKSAQLVGSLRALIRVLEEGAGAPLPG